ncbi:SAM-dependent methyltransferase [Dactylosporangium sp. NPDC049140]|uniref:SAM-dependent methyltransferase n=1 Tax=Dactylosporangium sp. NPDC049140 TaxID=3155647 RepID=UPI0033EB0A12
MAGARTAGIPQFLDVGSGYRTAPDVHEALPRAISPDSRVLYVDNDPVVVAHARALLTSPTATPSATCRQTCATRQRSWTAPQARATATRRTPWISGRVTHRSHTAPTFPAQRQTEGAPPCPNCSPRSRLRWSAPC